MPRIGKRKLGMRAREAEDRLGKPRLADLAAFETWELPSWCRGFDHDSRRAWQDIAGQTKAAICESPIVVADNVAEFLYAENPKEEWDYESDFPCCVPPFPSFFLEMRRPSRLLSEGVVKDSGFLPPMWGWAITTTTIDDHIAQIGDSEFQSATLDQAIATMERLQDQVDLEAVEQAMIRLKGSIRELTNPHDQKALYDAMEPLGGKDREFFQASMMYAAMRANKGKAVSRNSFPPGAAWMMHADLVMLAEGRVFGLVSSFTVTLSEEGRLLSKPAYRILGGQFLDPESIQGYTDTFSSYSFPALLALSFMNCKNVALAPVQPNVELNRMRQARGVKPLLRYNVIDIDPMKSVLRTEGDIESNGLQRALHICRGHFATYTEDKPLFGHFTGTVWKSAHVRGTAKAGVVVKDYRINTPKP